MNTLDNLDLSKRDPGGMAGRIAAMGDDAARAFEAALRLEWKAVSAPRAVILAGMGGSAISGDLLRDYAEDELRAPVLVVREYGLPAWAGPDCLFVAASYSGGTEETLSSYADARRRGIPTVALCSGGRLKELAVADSVPWAGFPGGYQPRAALGWSFFTLLGAFIRLGLIGPRDREVAGAVRAMQDGANRLGPEVPEERNQAKQLARWMSEGLPILYSPGRRLGAVAFRWRTQINENGKYFAHQATLPEQNHNEIVGWEKSQPWLRGSRVVGLRDRDDHPRVQARLRIACRMAEEAGAGVQMLETEGESLLQRLFSLLVLGDWVSLYLGFINGVDPTPVANIDRLKSELEKPGAP